MDNEVQDRSSLAHWYIIHTYSTFERKVRDDILQMVENNGLQDFIFDVVVPEKDEVIEKADGKRKTVRRCKFPSYAFIKMIYTDHVYFMVTHIRGVTHFVGLGGKPEPLPPEEVRRMGLEKIKASELGLEIGDQVRIVSGAFESYYGVVSKIDEEQGVVEVIMSMFGKPTPIKLDFNEVIKA